MNKHVHSLAIIFALVFLPATLEGASGQMPQIGAIGSQENWTTRMQERRSSLQLRCADTCLSFV